MSRDPLILVEYRREPRRDHKRTFSATFIPSGQLRRKAGQKIGTTGFAGTERAFIKKIANFKKQNEKKLKDTQEWIEWQKTVDIRLFRRHRLNMPTGQTGAVRVYCRHFLLLHHGTGVPLYEGHL